MRAMLRTEFQECLGAIGWSERMFAERTRVPYHLVRTDKRRPKPEVELTGRLAQQLRAARRAIEQMTR